jgi:hypothetical protein
MWEKVESPVRYSEKPRLDNTALRVNGLIARDNKVLYPPFSSCNRREGRLKQFEQENTPFLPTAIGEQYSQTIMNI